MTYFVSYFVRYGYFLARPQIFDADNMRDTTIPVEYTYLNADIIQLILLDLLIMLIIQ